jgi:hypothetical protein
MLYRERALAALEGLREEFLRFQAELSAQFSGYEAALEQLSYAQLLELLGRQSRPGAIPTEELARHRSLIVRFGARWQNRQQADQWAYETLLGRTTFAADGSQITPSKLISIPIAAIQVGWFENPHTPDGAYTKDVRFEVLTPDQVVFDQEGLESQQVVHCRRYGLEVSVICDFIKRAASRGFDPARPPVVFFDNLLVASFAEPLPAEQRDFYVSEIIRLLDESEDSGIPIVGYVDSSSARDLAVMLEVAFGLQGSAKVNDAALLAPRMGWGDRTAMMRCARRGILDSYGERWRDGIGFVYLKTVSDAPPARLEIPLWVYERGLLDYVIDTVRAEVIIGGGYPYALETADSVAVLGAPDRESFYALFQEFASRSGISLRISRKESSKRWRR